MLTVYGIKNCNTMKKCFDYLKASNIDYELIDYKKQCIDFDTFFAWVQCFGLNKVINQQGTTYKKLDDDKKAIIAHAITNLTANQDDLTAVYDIVANHLSMIKRPIVTGVYDNKEIALVGFDKSIYDNVLSPN